MKIRSITLNPAKATSKMDNKNILLRSLPKVDESILELKNRVGKNVPDKLIKIVVKESIQIERNRILDGCEKCEVKSKEQWGGHFEEALNKRMRSNLRRVINGSGVVIHTNLGRSILSEKTMEVLTQAGGYYTNLEFNLEAGKRGSRYSLVEDIICDLTGAEAAVVVNNNAAAVLIALDTLAKGKEVIVSRGQLVEIGGSFRIPDVMAKSGACLKEVGATNRTHLYDYEDAITEHTSMLLRVHTSNFRIIGFTADVAAEDMVQLAREKGLVTMEDLGSGSLVDFSQYGFPKEPTVQEIVKAGVDVVTFSGDKLLGGPQAGLIVGTKEVIARIKKNPLNRALRIDKFTLAALESVLREYYEIDNALMQVPTLRMLTISTDELKKRVQRLVRRLKAKLKDKAELRIVSTVSRVGGGALPEYNLPSWALLIEPSAMSVSTLENRLRAADPPIIGRIEDEKFLIDIRTIQEREISELADLLIDFFSKE